MRYPDTPWFVLGRSALVKGEQAYMYQPYSISDDMDNDARRAGTVKNTKLYLAAWAVLIFVAALACLTDANAAEGYLSVGKTAGGGYAPVGTASAGVRFEKYGMEATYIAEAPLYGGPHLDNAIGMLTAYRYWEYPRLHFLGADPEFIMGLSLKSADRCNYNGELNCNRRMPLPVEFHFGLGLQWKDIRVDLYHDSNDALDHGDEKKNLGVNWLSLTYRFR